MSFWRAMVLAWVAGCFGCGGDANSPDGDGDPADHREGLELLCEAEARSGGLETFPFATKMQTVNGWLDRELKDPWVRTLHREKLPQAALGEQGAMLRRHAAAAGIAECPMAGLIEFLGGLSAVAHGVEDCAKSCVERHRDADVEELGAKCAKGCGG